MSDLLDEDLPAAVPVFENDPPVTDSQSEGIGNTGKADDIGCDTGSEPVQSGEHPTPRLGIQASNVTTCATG